MSQEAKPHILEISTLVNNQTNQPFILLHFEYKIRTKHSPSGTQVMVEKSSENIIYTPQKLCQYSVSHQYSKLTEVEMVLS